MPAAECLSGACDAAEPGVWSDAYLGLTGGLSYSFARLMGYSDDEAIVYAYEQQYDVDLSDEQRDAALLALATDDTSVLMDTIQGLPAGVGRVAGAAAGEAARGAAQGWSSTVGPVGTVAAVALVGAALYAWSR